MPRGRPRVASRSTVLCHEALGESERTGISTAWRPRGSTCAHLARTPARVHGWAASPPSLTRVHSSSHPYAHAPSHTCSDAQTGTAITHVSTESPAWPCPGPLTPTLTCHLTRVPGWDPQPTVPHTRTPSRAFSRHTAGTPGVSRSHALRGRHAEAWLQPSRHSYMRRLTHSLTHVPGLHGWSHTHSHRHPNSLSPPETQLDPQPCIQSPVAASQRAWPGGRWAGTRPSQASAHSQAPCHGPRTPGPRNTPQQIPLHCKLRCREASCQPPQMPQQTIPPFPELPWTPAVPRTCAHAHTHTHTKSRPSTGLREQLSALCPLLSTTAAPPRLELHPHLPWNTPATSLPTIHSCPFSAKPL